MNKREANQLIKKAQGFLGKYLRLMYKPEALNSFPNVQVGIGGGAYTNGRSLYVGLAEGFIEGEEGYEQYKAAMGHDPTPEEAMTELQGLGCHELFHIFFSSWPEMDAWRNWWTEEFRELWDGKSEYHKNLVGQLGQFWLNAVEDGRIENLGGNDYPGVISKLRFNNLVAWSIHNQNKSKSEFRNMSIALCFYATTGIFPTWWADMDKEFHDNMELIMPGVDRAINMGNPTTARREFQKDVLRIKKFILELLKKEMSQADTMEALAEMVKAMMEEFKGCSGSGSGGKGGSRSTPDVGDGSCSVRISVGGGDESDEDSEDSDDSDGNDSGDAGEGEDDADGSSGSGKDEGDEEKDGNSGKDGKDDKDGDKDSGESGKDGEDGKGDKSGPTADDLRKEKRAPGHAQRGGKEGKENKSKANQNNNGQGHTDGTNAAPDTKDETLTHSKQELIDAVKAEMDKIEEDMSESVRRDESRVTRAEKAENAKDDGISKSEIEEIRNSYPSGGYYPVEGYKEVKVTAKEKPDDRVAQQGKRFRREVEKLLKTQVESRVRGTTRGRLSPGMLYRMKRNDFGIFETKSTPDKTDAAVYILWDNSGSMYGSKQRLSTLACSVIEEGLKGLIPLKITAFTTESGMVKHFRVKDFSDKDKGHNYAWSHGTARGFSGGNKDGYSIKVATKEIMKRPEQLKLLIVLSDGLPSDYPGQQTAMDDVKTAVKDARKSGVEVISVMFGEDDFRSSEFKNYEYMYQTGIIATSPEKLTSELIKQIRKILFNKGR